MMHFPLPVSQLKNFYCYFPGQQYRVSPDAEQKKVISALDALLEEDAWFDTDHFTETVNEWKDTLISFTQLLFSKSAVEQTAYLETVTPDNTGETVRQKIDAMIEPYYDHLLGQGFSDEQLTKGGVIGVKKFRAPWE